MSSGLRVKLATFEDGISCVGIRRVSSYVKTKHPDTQLYVYNVSGSTVHARNIVFDEKKPDTDHVHINSDFLDEVSDADVIGFSGMTKFLPQLRTTISEVRKRNPRAFIVWGGAHATVYPQDCLDHGADAACVGEAEHAFANLLDKYAAEESIEDCASFWLKRSSLRKRSGRLPMGNGNSDYLQNPLTTLMNGEQLGSMPFQDYGFDLRYATHDGVQDMTKDVYIAQQGSKYMTLWTLGCPFKCTYCANNKYLENDKGYGKIRHASPEFIVREFENVVKQHDYVSYIELEDDMFLLLQLDDLKRFGQLYKERVGLPFFVSGIHPNTVRAEKVEVLVDAGLAKVRMGLQGGSQRILDFYKRGTTRAKILESSAALASFAPRIIPPFYDIILDNPIETAQDKEETIELLYEMKRPYMLYVYSLRTIPGTELEQFAKANPQLDIKPIENTYQALTDQETGFMVYLLALYRPSRPMLKMFRKISKIPLLRTPVFFAVRVMYLFKRAYYELKVKNLQPLSMVSPRLAVLYDHTRRMFSTPRACP
jgi:radical SAM superfamily enzyme YgiQ (UPF0313 family)